MESISLSALVVSCKNYVPAYNWYLRKSNKGVYGAAKAPDCPGYDESRLDEYEQSDDYVLMPECPRMTDEEAAEVIKDWCVKNHIPYEDDMDRIEEEYRAYYGYR